MKHMIFYIIVICFPFVILELFFQLLPVSYPPHILPVNDENPVARFQPGVSYLWSRDWNFSIVNRKRTNNLGFVSDFDYERKPSTPLMAVIGDSYVEAQQVTNEESISGRLATKAAAGRVYSFGLSGAALSQYLVYAEYARRQVQPDALVFVIVGNDFDESLLKYKQEPRLHYFAENNDGYTLQRIDYSRNPINTVLRKSAFVRYVMLNLQFKQLFNRPHADQGEAEFVANVPREVSEERLEDSRRAVDEFFRQLLARSGLGSRDILFLVDGMRPQLYSEQGLQQAQSSYAGQMRTYFMATAENLGYEVRDMQPVFVEKNRLDGTVFEFARDGHWNRTGHELAAAEIAASKVFSRTFPDPAMGLLVD